MATQYITVSDEKFYHSRRKTADTLNDLNEKCRYDALGNGMKYLRGIKNRK